MRNTLLFLIVSLLLGSCVSGRKYTRVLELYKTCKADSAIYRMDAEKYREESNRYRMANIKLMQDTMRLYTEYSAMALNYNKLLNEGYAEAARVSRQLTENKKKYSLTLPQKNKTEVIAKGMNDAVEVVKESIQSSLSGCGATVTKEQWSLIVGLNDSLVFDPSGQGLSPAGKRVVSIITNALSDKNNFDVLIRERIPSAALYTQETVPFSTEIPVTVVEKVVEKRIKEVDTIPNKLAPVPVDTLLARATHATKGVENSYMKPEKPSQVIAVDTLPVTLPLPEKKRFRVPVPHAKSTLLYRVFQEQCKGRSGMGVMVERIVDPRIKSDNLKGRVEIVLTLKAGELYKLINGEGAKR